MFFFSPLLRLFYVFSKVVENEKFTDGVIYAACFIFEGIITDFLLFRNVVIHSVRSRTLAPCRSPCSPPTPPTCSGAILAASDCQVHRDRFLAGNRENA